jgi:hypothetical protein
MVRMDAALRLAARQHHVLTYQQALDTGLKPSTVTRLGRREWARMRLHGDKRFFEAHCARLTRLAVAGWRVAQREPRGMLS